MAVQAEIARRYRKKNRARRIRQEQKVVTKKSRMMRKSCRSLVPAIGDQIFSPNSYRCLLRGKASMDERHQTFE